MTPLPHQERNLQQLQKALATYGAALDASATGTGKTATVCFLAKSLDAKLAVVCPLACIAGWERTCAAIGVKTVFITNYEACKSKNFAFGKLNTGGRKRYEWHIPEPRVIMVFDEVHRCRARATVNTLMLLAAARQHKTVMLSATPFTDPLEAYGIGSTLKLFSQSEFFHWAMKNGVRKNHFGYFEFKGDESHIRKIHEQIFPGRGVRTRHDEIPGFPKTQILADVIETGSANEIQQVYLNALQEKVAAETAEHAEFEMEVPGVTRYLRERQEIELLKTKAMAERAKDAKDRGNTVILFVNFQASVDTLRVLLNTRDVITGGQPSQERARVVRAFINNRIPYVIVNNSAGGTGLDLHDITGSGKERTSLISPPLSAIALKQVLGRPHRQGGGFSQQVLLFAANTLEETKMLPRVQAKLTNLDLLVDGDLDVFSN